MAKRDFLVKAAVDAADAQRSRSAAHAPPILMLVVSVAAAVDARRSRASPSSPAAATSSTSSAPALLARLHTLGPVVLPQDADRRDHEPRDQRSRAGAPAARLRRPQRRRARSSRSRARSTSWSACRGELTLASLATLPLLMLVTRTLLDAMFTPQPREPGGDRQDERSRAREPRRRARRALASRSRRPRRRAFDASEPRLPREEPRARAPPRLDGPDDGRDQLARRARRLLVRRQPRARAARSRKGDFVAFWLALLRLTWPMLALGFVVGDRPARARRLRAPQGDLRRGARGA